MDSYITFSVMVNLKAGDDISFLIIALRSSIQQLFRLVLDGLAVFEHLSICRWNVRSYQCTVIIGLWTKMVLCRALLKWKPCAFQVGEDMLAHISYFPGGMWAILNVFKHLWCNTALKRSAAKCGSYSEKYKRWAPLSSAFQFHSSLQSWERHITETSEGFLVQNIRV